MNKKIMGGAFILARQIFSSSIWKDKPATWKIIWVYILGNVNHKDNGKFKRGEGFFQPKKILDDIGTDITPDIFKKCLVFLRKEGMISTKRSTRGVTIKVINYNRFQTLNNYLSTDISTKRSTRGALEEHQRSTTINKNDKNDKKIHTPPSKISKRMVDLFLEVTKLKRPDGDYLMDNLFPAKEIIKYIREECGEKITKETEILKYDDTKFKVFGEQEALF